MTTFHGKKDLKTWVAFHLADEEAAWHIELAADRNPEQLQIPKGTLSFHFFSACAGLAAEDAFEQQENPSGLYRIAKHILTFREMTDFISKNNIKLPPATLMKIDTPQPRFVIDPAGGLFPLRKKDRAVNERGHVLWPKQKDQHRNGDAAFELRTTRKTRLLRKIKPGI